MRRRLLEGYGVQWEVKRAERVGPGTQGNRSERKVELMSVPEYASTMCCCECGELTEAAPVTTRDTKTGELTTRRSR